MSKQKQESYFYNDHLNEEGIALYADALTFHTQDSLPEPILKHVENCEQCKKRILFINKITSSHSNYTEQNKPWPFPQKFKH